MSLGHAKIFFKRTQKVLLIRGKYHKLDYIKIKSFYLSQDTMTREKESYRVESIFALHFSNKRLVSRL